MKKKNLLTIGVMWILVLLVVPLGVRAEYSSFILDYIMAKDSSVTGGEIDSLLAEFENNFDRFNYNQKIDASSIITFFIPKLGLDGDDAAEKYGQALKLLFEKSADVDKSTQLRLFFSLNNDYFGIYDSVTSNFVYKKISDTGILRTLSLKNLLSDIMNDWVARRNSYYFDLYGFAASIAKGTGDPTLLELSNKILSDLENDPKEIEVKKSDTTNYFFDFSENKIVGEKANNIYPYENRYKIDYQDWDITISAGKMGTTNPFSIGYHKDVSKIGLSSNSRYEVGYGDCQKLESSYANMHRGGAICVLTKEGDLVKIYFSRETSDKLYLAWEYLKPPLESKTEGVLDLIAGGKYKYLDLSEKKVADYDNKDSIDWDVEALHQVDEVNMNANTGTKMIPVKKPFSDVYSNDCIGKDSSGVWFKPATHTICIKTKEGDLYKIGKYRESTSRMYLKWEKVIPKPTPSPTPSQSSGPTASPKTIPEPSPPILESPKPEISPLPITRPKPAAGVSIEKALDLDEVKGQLKSYHISGIQSKVSEDYSTLTAQDKEFLLKLPNEISKRSLEKEVSVDDSLQVMIATVFEKENDEDSWIKSISSMGKLKGENAYNFLSYLLETRVSGPAYYSDKVYDAVISASRENGDPRLSRQIDLLNFVNAGSNKDVVVESVNLLNACQDPTNGQCEVISPKGHKFDLDPNYLLLEAKVRNLGQPRDFLITTHITRPDQRTQRFTIERRIEGTDTIALTVDDISKKYPGIYDLGNEKVKVRIEIRDFDGYKNVVSGEFGQGQHELTIPLVNRYGILLSKSNSNTIQSNIIVPITGVYASLYLLSSTENNVIGNKISATGSGHGILFEKGSNKNRLSSNSILTQGKGSYGIYLKGSDDVTMSNDIILSASSKDVVAKDSNMKLVNVSFNKRKTAFEDKANLEVVNVIDVTIKDAITKEPINGVKIEIKDNKGSKVVEESLPDGHRKNLELIKSKLTAVRDPTQKQVTADSTQITSEVRPIPPSVPLSGDSWEFLPEYQPGESVYEAGIVDDALSEGMPVIAPEPMPPNDVLQHKSLIEENIPSGRLSFQEEQPNSPPAFSSTPITEAHYGSEYDYLITVTDPDASDQMHFIKGSAPDGMVVIDNEDGRSGTVKWSPSENQKGQTFDVLIAVDDRRGAENSIAIQQFKVKVGSNLAPDITTDAPTSGTIGAEYRYSLIALDKDKDQLKITLLDGPTGFNLVDNKDGTATATWTPQSADNYNVEIQVDDGKGDKNSKIVEKFTISVSSPGSVTEPTDEPVQPVKVEDDSPTYLLIAEAPGYEKLSFSIDLSKMGSVELFLVKAGSQEQPPSPSTAPSAGGASGESSAASGASSLGGSSGFAGPTIRSVKPVVKTGPSLKLDRQLIDISANVGGVVNINEIIPVTNNGNKDLDLEIRVEGIDKLSVNTPKLKISVGEQKIIKLEGSISGLKLGSYTGKVIITPGGLESQEVKILLTVKQSEKEKLFDLVLDFDKKDAIFVGDNVDVKTKLVNVAGQSFDVKVRYKLKDFNGNTVFEETENVKSPEASKTFVKTLKTSGIKPGDYVLEASIIDNQQQEVAIAALTSHINGQLISKQKGGESNLGIILPIIIVVVGALLTISLRRKYAKRR